MSDGVKKLAVHGPGDPRASPPPVARVMDLLKSGETMRRAATRSGLELEQALRQLADEVGAGERMALTDSIDTRIRLRLMSLANQAVDVIEQALEQGNASVALELLSALGMIRTFPVAREAAGPEKLDEHRVAAPWTK